MAFGKAVQNVIAREVLDEYDRENKAYSEAQSKLQKLRMLGDHPNAADEDIIAYAKYRREFREISKAYHVARGAFLIAIKVATKREISISDAQAVATLENLSVAEQQRIRKAAVFEEELSSGQNQGILDAALTYMKEHGYKTPEIASVKDQFLSKEQPNDLASSLGIESEEDLFGPPAVKRQYDQDNQDEQDKQGE